MSTPRPSAAPSCAPGSLPASPSLYGTEVPAYRTLVEVAQEVNQRVIAREGADAERLGSIDRVTAERHGAIRVGTPEELAQVSRVFGALGMFSVRVLRPARRGAGAGPRRLHGVPAPRPRRAGGEPVPGVHLDAGPRGPTLLRPGSRGPAAELPGRPRALPRRAPRPGRRRHRARGAVGSRCGPVPGAGRRVLRALRRPGRPGLVRRARAHLGCRRRHRRCDDDPHQPPHSRACSTSTTCTRPCRPAGSR